MHKQCHLLYSTFITWTEWTLTMTLWSWWQHYKYRPGYIIIIKKLLVLVWVSNYTSIVSITCPSQVTLRCWQLKWNVSFLAMSTSEVDNTTLHKNTHVNHQQLRFSSLEQSATGRHVCAFSTSFLQAPEVRSLQVLFPLTDHTVVVPVQWQYVILDTLIIHVMSHTHTHTLGFNGHFSTWTWLPADPLILLFHLFLNYRAKFSMSFLKQSHSSMALLHHWLLWHYTEHISRPHSSSVNSTKFVPQTSRHHVYEVLWLQLPTVFDLSCRKYTYIFWLLFNRLISLEITTTETGPGSI